MCMYIGVGEYLCKSVQSHVTAGMREREREREGGREGGREGEKGREGGREEREITALGEQKKCTDTHHILDGPFA